MKIPDQKCCAKCKEVKNSSEFYKHPTHSDGLQSYCKKCFNLIMKQRKIDKAGIIKLANKRYYEKHKAENKLKYTEEDREKKLAYQVKWYKDNQKRLKEKQCKYYSEVKKKNQEEASQEVITVKCCTHCKQQKNVDEFMKSIQSNDGHYTICKKCNNKKRKWYHIRREKRILDSKSAPPSIEEINKLIEDSNNKCFWCEQEIPNRKLHLDHIYPLSKGGEHNINNMVVSCASCNCSKGAKNPEDFLEEIMGMALPIPSLIINQ